MYCTPRQEACLGLSCTVAIRLRHFVITLLSSFLQQLTEYQRSRQNNIISLVNCYAYAFFSITFNCWWELHLLCPFKQNRKAKWRVTLIWTSRSGFEFIIIIIFNHSIWMSEKQRKCFPDSAVAGASTGGKKAKQKNKASLFSVLTYKDHLRRQYSTGN